MESLTMSCRNLDGKFLRIPGYRRLWLRGGQDISIWPRILESWKISHWSDKAGIMDTKWMNYESICVKLNVLLLPHFRGFSPGNLPICQTHCNGIGQTSWSSTILLKMNLETRQGFPWSVNGIIMNTGWPTHYDSKTIVLFNIHSEYKWQDQ